jgi:hypothetical protein
MGSMSADKSLRRRAAVQMGYAALLALFVLWPNLQASPSLVLIVATALAAVWLVGGLAAWAKVPRADELLLCGASAPVLVGLTQLAYRVDFLRTHGALTRPGVATDSAGGFLAVWAAELVLVLIPGLIFVWWNARALAPVDTGRG